MKDIAMMLAIVHCYYYRTGRVDTGGPRRTQII